MKTIEEKAKAYDEALERARKFYANEQTRVGLTPIDLESIFPELKESEGEKIRKWLIEYFGKINNEIDIQDRGEIISWLEKQGTPTDINPSEFDLRLNKLLKQFETLPKEELVNCLSFYLNTVQNDGIYQRADNPADKVEPKFKVGDWCIDNEDGTIFQIVKVLDNTYTYKTNEGKEYSCTHYSLENDARLWSIKDAKAGDVLATLNHILIFEKILPKDGGVSYCHYDFGSSTPQFDFNRDGGWYFGKEAKVYPATKEQRDALMKAMAEAGYTFDFEKKELKKIEQVYDVGADTQKSVEWEPQTGDTFRKKGTTSPTYHLCEKQEDSIIFSFVENREVGISGGEITLFALKQDYELVERPKSIEDVVEEELNKALQTKVEQKSVWGEEDEKMLDDAIGAVYAADYYTYDDKEEIEHWLKSLKERYTWKPSDEQIKQLGWIAKQNKDNMIGKELISLYQDLKKLREE